ncbi:MULTISPECIES: LysR family transcriptional regulator [Kurthia]|uniref:LysR family transcriptional regulator n=1 Tax=Kurthia TaxID=1649 RepID=UPI00116CEDF1|nr:LysR family transcriptional regulator [Kurthia gibsonii]GED19587.1 putative HTH-type transcriptional regulator YybE [Kurthia gibsonii]
MDLQQLKYFQTVARLEHMTRAADVLNISQPALSKAISQLEHEVGAPLFERVGRAIRLNRYGALFLERTEPITQILDEAKQEIRDLVAPNSGTVAIGFTHSMGTRLVSRAVQAFQKEYPETEFEFVQRNSLPLVQDLNKGLCDLCLIPHLETDIPIDWRELWREEVYVIVPLHHRFAKQETIRLQDLAEDSFVTIKEGNSLRQIQNHVFEQVGISPNIVFEGEEFHTVASFVEAGFGVGLLPDLQRIDGYQIKRLHVTDVVCERRIGIATMKGRYIPQVAKQFEAFVSEHLYHFTQL